VCVFLSGTSFFSKRAQKMVKVKTKKMNAESILLFVKNRQFPAANRSSRE
jgi:hypothetical protein